MCKEKFICAFIMSILVTFYMEMKRHKLEIWHKLLRIIWNIRWKKKRREEERGEFCLIGTFGQGHYMHRYKTISCASFVCFTCCPHNSWTLRVLHDCTYTHTHKVKYNEFQYSLFIYSTSMIFKTPCPKLMKSFPTT